MVRPQRGFEFLKVATKKCNTLWIRLVVLAGRPVDASSVAVFRVLFGTIFCFSMVRFVGKGWVAKLYLEPANNVTYPFFGWIKPLPEPIMYLHIFTLATLGLCIAIGYRQRLSAGLLTLGFLYLELIEATRYLNHYWLVTLIALLLTILPVNNIWTLDAAVGRVPGSTTVPVFVVWTLRAQLSCVYVFAGIAKLNEDWLVHAQPMRLWLADRAEIYLAGPLLSTTETAFAASWAGAIFDCTIVGWLLWKRSRRLAYGTLVVFHLLTAALFPIGVFPLLMIATMLLFFEPDWPRKVFRLSSPPATATATATATAQIKPKSTTPLLIFLALFASVQILLPLRHYAYDTNVRWTEQGYYGSWRVMLSEKTGYLRFEVTDPKTDRSWLVKPTVVLTDWQAEQVAIRPDLILATAHLLTDHYEEQGFAALEIRAITGVTLNGRKNQPIIDPSTNLATLSRINPGNNWLETLDSSS